MRDIKFRAFHKPSKTMEYLRPFGTSQAEGSHIIFGCEEYGHRFYDSLNENDWEWMQWTGLQDKNGEDIYEGDVVKWVREDWVTKNDKMIWEEVTSTSVIIYRGNGFCVKDEHFGWEGEGLWDWDEIEVIGNIHENGGQVPEGAEI